MFERVNRALLKAALVHPLRPGETWRQVPGFSKYAASTRWRVRSITTGRIVLLDHPLDAKVRVWNDAGRRVDRTLRQLVKLAWPQHQPLHQPAGADSAESPRPQIACPVTPGLETHGQQQPYLVDIKELLDALRTV